MHARRPLTSLVLPFLLLAAAAAAQVDETRPGNPRAQAADSAAGLEELDWLAADAALPDSLIGLPDSLFFLPPALEFASHSLQDLLREHQLDAAQNESSVEIFRVDSSLALSLWQLRAETYPRYHPFSDIWVYIWRGRGQLTVNDRELEYGPGHFLQIPAGVLHSFRNISGAPTAALVWQRPPLVDSLTVTMIPEEVLVRMRADSLRALDLETRSLYKSR
jgi:mannose-6-phosphate isomerase-like protein (cupin superfamily)